MGMANNLANRWAAGERPLSDRLDAGFRRHRLLRQCDQSHAHAAAVGDARDRRLSRHPAGAQRGRDDRSIDHDGARTGADRNRDRQLALLDRRAAIAAAPVQYASDNSPATRARTDLPRPMRRLDVEHVAVAAPGGNGYDPVRTSISVSSAGEALAVVGPSAAGKTSLIRTLTGVWPPARGKIRLDGAALEQWDEDALGVPRRLCGPACRVLRRHDCRKYRAHELSRPTPRPCWRPAARPARMT